MMTKYTFRFMQVTVKAHILVAKHVRKIGRFGLLLPYALQGGLCIYVLPSLEELVGEKVTVYRLGSRR